MTIWIGIFIAAGLIALLRDSTPEARKDALRHRASTMDWEEREAYYKTHNL